MKRAFVLIAAGLAGSTAHADIVDLTPAHASESINGAICSSDARHAAGIMREEPSGGSSPLLTLDDARIYTGDSDFGLPREVPLGPGAITGLVGLAAVAGWAFMRRQGLHRET